MSGNIQQPTAPAVQNPSPLKATTTTTLPPTKDTNNPSCKACRRRKIRCNRGHPCSYCVKTKLECVYPRVGPSSLTGKSGGRTDAASELLKRSGVPRRTFVHAADRGDGSGRSGGQSPVLRQEVSGPREEVDERVLERAGPGQRSPVGGFQMEEGVDGAVRGGGEQTAGRTDDRTSNGFLFSFYSTMNQLSPLHPPPERVFTLWQTFLENVDPLLKMFHTPTVQKQILRASQHLDQIPPPLEALMFSIYYAAATSLSCFECTEELKEERTTLLHRYRFGTEQALAKAGLLTTKDLTTLQACVLFLICARRDPEGPDVWTLTSLAIRIATRLGLNRDGTSPECSAFEIEMRRRLWWQICILDVRTAEDNGTEPSIFEHSFDTPFPSNVNDGDLDPGMSALPSGTGHGRTEMLFSLQRFEISYAVRKLRFSRQFSEHNSYPVMTGEEKNDFIDELRQRLEDKYLKYCDMKIPFCFVTASTARLILTKLKLVVCESVRPSTPMAMQIMKRTLFTTSINILEYSQALKGGVEAQKWLWLFQDYVEWDAIAYLLKSLTERSDGGDDVDRAWTVLDHAFDSQQSTGLDASKVSRWQNLGRLKSKALAARKVAAAAERQAGNQAVGNQHPEHAPQAQLLAAAPSLYVDSETSETAGNFGTFQPEAQFQQHSAGNSPGWEDMLQGFSTDLDQSVYTCWL